MPCQGLGVKRGSSNPRFSTKGFRASKERGGVGWCCVQLSGVWLQRSRPHFPSLHLPLRSGQVGRPQIYIYMCVYLVCVHMPSPLNPLEPPGKVPDQRRKRESEGGERTDEWSSLFRLRSVPPPLLVRFQQLGNAETTPRLADNPLTPVVISLQSACPTVRWRRA